MAFWADQGLSIEEYGILSATATGAGGLLAAISVPWLAERIGLARVAMISMVFIPFQAIMYMSFSELGIPAWSLLLPTYVFIAWVTSFYGYAASISRFRWVSGRVKQVLTMPCSLAFGILVYRAVLFIWICCSVPGLDIFLSISGHRFIDGRNLLCGYV